MKEQFLELCQNALRFNPGDEAEILLIHTRSQLTRFAQNHIHQNMGEENATIQWRIRKDYREGSYTTNRLDDEGLKRAATAALEIALNQPKNEELPGLAQGRKSRIFDTASSATETCSPSKRASLVNQIIRQTKKYKAVASGALCAQSMVVSVANTSGIRASQHITKAFLNFVPYREPLSGYSFWMGANIDDLPLTQLAEEALEKIAYKGEPAAIEPGSYQVVLSPYAVQNIVLHLAAIGFGAKAFLEKRSFMTKLMGKKIVSEKITIYDDGRDPEGVPIYFDYEGVLRKKVYFIEKGVAKGVVHDTKTAAQAGVKSTGHALPHPNHYGPYAMNLFMKRGNVPERELIAPVERGLYVTKFHYMNVVEPMTTVMTGMTKDGTFLIEKGKIVSPVRNMRFTQNMLEALKNVEAVGRERRCKGDFAVVTTPAVRMKRFRFTGVSEF
ncbi:TldD/PmbA family protein [Candidatus Sumerlaeota bacterium]|nr:TldD/PmbA family protein [Candidatus Sumerlaeota bacterium]